MDLPSEELPEEGVASIFLQAIAVFRSSPKHFSAITLVLGFPLSFSILAHSLITHPLFHRLHTYTTATSHHHPSSHSPLDALLAFQSLYFLFLFSFSLLSTAAIVYSAACIYTSKSLSFAKIISALPRLVKPLFHTFLWVFFIMTLYYVAFIVAFFLVVSFVTGRGRHREGLCLFVLLLLVLVFGILHICISAMWHLASVVSVLEESYGLAAMKKSRELLRGKMVVAGILVFAYFSACAAIEGIFTKVVVLGRKDHRFFGVKFFVGSALVLLLVVINLVGFLVQSVFYYVCKAYHHESIDKSALHERLGAYLGEYVPLKSSVQMEEM